MTLSRKIIVFKQALQTTKFFFLVSDLYSLEVLFQDVTELYQISGAELPYTYYENNNLCTYVALEMFKLKSYETTLIIVAVGIEPAIFSSVVRNSDH